MTPPLFLAEGRRKRKVSLSSRGERKKGFPYRQGEEGKEVLESRKGSYHPDKRGRGKREKKKGDHLQGEKTHPHLPLFTTRDKRKVGRARSERGERKRTGVATDACHPAAKERGGKKR